MVFKYSKLNDLSAHELFLCLRLRSNVFVVEQNCVYPDIDEKDLKAYHVLLTEDTQLAAYARLLPPGVTYPEPSIGRVVVDPAYRRKNLGQLLMKQCVNKTMELYKDQDIVISAQAYLENFYSRLGFLKEGDVYDEDGIPHFKMRLKTKA